MHSLKVKNITRETSKAVSISFDVPDSLKNQFQFQAGQYLTLEAIVNDKKVRRSYSICSTPHSGMLSVVVKEVPNGVFSSFVNKHLRENDFFKVALPEGRFVLTPNSEHQNTYVAFAAGSGITPIFSMLKTVLEQETESKFLLIYGNKSPEQTIFYEQLNQLKNEYPNRFMLEYVFSEVTTNEYKFGRIDTSLVNYFLKNKYTTLVPNRFFLCGPEQMINEVQNTLLNNGVETQNILFELFTTTPTTVSTADVADGFSQVSILVDEVETTVTLAQNKTLLEAALDNDIEVPYSCQGGICSSCIARITEGSATMLKNQILTDSEVAEGLVLTCQAQPTTTVVKVDYDDI